MRFGYELKPDLVVEAAYMGNQGTRLHNGALYRNQPTQAALENQNVNPYAWVWDAGSAATAGVPYPYAGFSGYAGFALQPYPQVAVVICGPIYSVGAPKGSSRYNSFQLSLTRRMTKGLGAQMSYNHSRAAGDTASAFDESWDAAGGIQNMYNLSQDAKTVLPYDLTHIFKGYVSYQLPFGKGRRFLFTSNRFVDALLGGWDVTWIFRYSSWAPLGVYTSVWYPGWNALGDGVIYADYNSGVNTDRKFDGSGFNPGTSNARGNLYFDTSAFSDPKGHKLGTGKHNYEELRTFGWSQEDIGLLKYWHFTDSISLQFRAEFINAFNRHHYADPGTYIGNAGTFGYVTGMTGDPRNVQFGLRLGF